MPASADIRETIRRQLDHTLVASELPELGTHYRGKVRDTYPLSNGRLVLVTTDRISAFDHVLRQAIPFKGQVLNQLAAFFFEATRDVVPNHLLAVPDPNVSVAVRCRPYPVEFVVRGYLAGHAWRTYRDGGRVLCGRTLPERLRQNAPLPEPILTPTTKAAEGHDADISREEIVRQGLMDAEAFDRVEDAALRVFARGSAMARARGLILADTKYEFGVAPDGHLALIDEVHTPDSSRYFYADGYEERLARNEPQRQLSKEFLREWLMAGGFQGREGERLPDLTDEFRIDVSSRYIELYEALTGTPFAPDTHPDPAARIRQALSAYLEG